jgi:cyclase
MSIIPRVIPTLLLDDEAFVKTTGYRAPRYVGDPVNVINLFNRFEVDEIVLLDIGATARRREPAFDLIGQLAAECWVPLAYGGGITTYAQARRIFSLGVEKVVLGTAVHRHPELLGEIARTYGRQAVVASVDVRRIDGRFEVFVDHATHRVSADVRAYARDAVELGAGEILLNSIDRDGAMGGYDLDLIRAVTAAVGVPVVACGGAGERGHLPAPVQLAGAAAVAAGSLFVFQGRARGVVVNFPQRSELEVLFGMRPTA